MKILEIKKYPEDVLRQPCRKVDGVGKREQVRFRQMLLTMKKFEGIGLAAPQIGISEQMMVADIGDGPLCLANPEIISRNGNSSLNEGCLSIPETFVKIERSHEVVVIGIDEKGEKKEVTAKGLMATVLQHEIDHLKGKLIIDYLPLVELARFEMKNRN